MTQLLISIKNAAESLLALDAGADIIDLKDPNVGALGALNLAETKQIVLAINGGAQLSATVGEDHASLDELIKAIETRADLGVNMVKIAASVHFYADDFVQKMQMLTQSGVKIVAVFFADEVIDVDLLEKIKQAGFCGAMLDTKIKQHNLLQVQTKDDLQKFTQKCHQQQLKLGLAGSLRSQHIVFLVEFNPTYLGFRGGVCDDLMRKSDLNRAKITEVKELLRQHNKINAKAQKS